MADSFEGRTLARLRRWVMVLLVVGLVATEIELILIDHYEDAWQLAPIAAIGLALVLLAWHGLASSRASIQSIRGVMILLVVTGVAGIVLHFRGNMEFQLEMDPSQTSWVLFSKVMRAKAPPALAPALLSQLGIL
jgi:hypothetical protein